MAKIDAKVIKELRDLTGAGILDIKNTLDEFDGNVDKAKEKLMEKAKEKAAKKAERSTNDGLVYSYIHNNGKVGSLIYLACETDFVAKTDDFQNLCKEIAMQAATMEYKDVDELLEDDYIRDGSKKIKDLITEAIGKLGENMELISFARFKVGA